MKPTIAQIIELKNHVSILFDAMHEAARKYDQSVNLTDGKPVVPDSLKSEHSVNLTVYRAMGQAYFNTRADFEAMVYRFTNGMLHEKKDMGKLLDMEDGTLEALLEAMEGRH